MPDDILRETEIAERVATSISNVKALGEKSLYSCPDCGGGLWEINEGNVIHYRCHTGHTYTQNELVLRKNEEMENTLWIALRILEERKSLLDKMAKEESSKGWIRSAGSKTERSAELQTHIERLKEVLFQTKDNKVA